VKRFRELLAGDELIPLFGVARCPHPVVVEMFGLAGNYKGFWIDQEHADVSGDQVQMLAIAGRANDLDCFVRMPPVGYWQVTQCLEAGAGGVMAAQIQSANQAREFVSWTQFAPRGVRGLNTGGRDADYTHKPAARFVEDANREHFVAIQIETLGALEQVEEIAALDGVDILFVGPADLSLCLGVVGQFHHEKLWEAIERVAAACRKRGKTWGCVAADPEFADRAVASGCRMPSLGSDILALRGGIENFCEAFSNQIGR
jgi:2-dehydro-3-deoxyglucarate aldolase/4-hydroxy-2-oxoheptanedioate aldolase